MQDAMNTDEAEIEDDAADNLIKEMTTEVANKKKALVETDAQG
jgi:hypothetical protein